MKAFASKAGSRGESEPFGGGRKKCVASDRDKKNLCISRYGFIGLILDVYIDGLDENVTHIKEARYSG